MGPVELLIVTFPGNRFSGEVLPALVELVETGFQRFVSGGIVRVLDLVLVAKDEQGRVAVFELDDLEPDAFGIFSPVVNDLTPLLNDDDVHMLAGTLANNSSAAIMLFENVWATRFADAIHAAKGEVVLNERLPRVVVEEIVAAIE